MPKRVLIAPLHWGLGHAARCIPIVRQQLDEGNEVFIAANGGPKALLQQHFPNAAFVDIPFMEITYPRDGNMVRHFTRRGLRLVRSIWKEHRVLKRMVTELGLDTVISDGRFGLWTKGCTSVFVHHQIEIRTPVFQGIVNRLNRWVMNRYSEVWIPDYELAPGLAGALSHPKHMPKRFRYIGPLSRFTPELHGGQPGYTNLALISGPEPQRQLFEAELARQFVESNMPSLIVRGKPDDAYNEQIGNLRIVHHLDDAALVEALLGAQHIFARSGYSTIMDFHVLGISATYIPTPGQTEQEYLAMLHAEASTSDDTD